MKAWRLEAEAINKRIAAGSKEPRARVQMRQREAISRYYKAKGSGNWLMDGMFLRNGFKRAVYGEPVTYPNGTEVYDDVVRHPLPGDGGKSILGKIMSKAKAWWNKR